MVKLEFIYGVPPFRELCGMASWGEGQGPEAPVLPPHPSPNPSKSWKGGA